MSANSNESTTFKWKFPSDVMKLQKLKKQKKALQARLNSSETKTNGSIGSTIFENTAVAKRKNPFLTNRVDKKAKCDRNVQNEESSDQTLFKLLHFTDSNLKGKENATSFNKFFNETVTETNNVEIVKVDGETWIPIDWALKTKIRFLSSKPFQWNQKLKISEEASGVTGFARCLDINNSGTSLDASPKAKFHQCCLYWQQPSLPWLNLYPRRTGKSTTMGAGVASITGIKESLHNAWTDSLRSLFQLIRTRQCPYFYACANNFTVLFRAAGIGGFSETHVLITPTTRGFRHILRQEEIEFTMPLKKGRYSDLGYESLDSTGTTESDIETNEDESPDDQWLQSMGINAEDIKQINYTQTKIEHKAETKVDNSEQSLIFIEGMEVQAFYNFLINCKSAVALTGPYAGIPPTLLAPVAFHGATLNGLKVRDCKVHVDNEDYYSLELTGPILPHTIHNLCRLLPEDHSITATFANVPTVASFSKVTLPTNLNNSKEISNEQASGGPVFLQENLSDCGLKPAILKQFCSGEAKHVTNMECLKYTSETKTYSWT